MNKRRRFDAPPTPNGDPSESESQSKSDSDSESNKDTKAIEQESTPSRDDDEDFPNPDQYQEITDPKLVFKPVLDIVTPALRNAWAINNNNKMSLIFDVINPVRKFKRGALYDDNKDNPYADYDPNHDEDPNVTETDEDGNTQPYNPIYHV